MEKTGRQISSGTIMQVPPDTNAGWNSLAQKPSSDPKGDYPDAIDQMQGKAKIASKEPTFDFSKMKVPENNEVSKFDFSRMSVPSAMPNREKPLSPLDRGAGERMLGVEELVNNLGIGKHIGLPSNEILQGAINIAEEQGRSARKGQGISSNIGSFIAEQIGDPVNWLGGEFFKGAKTIPKIAEAGGRFGATSGISAPGNTTPEKAVKKAVEEGTIGAALTSAFPAASRGGKVLMEGFHARTPEELTQAAAAIRKESDTSYEAMRKANAYIAPAATKRMKQEVGQTLAKNGIMNDHLHAGTLSVLKQAEKASKNGINLEVLDQHRRLLSAVINNNPKSEDAKMARDAIRAIDESVDNLKPSDLTNDSKSAVESLNKARATWAKARKFEMISDIVEKSNGDPNRMKVLLDQLRNNKNKIRGFTDEEKKVLNDAANNTTAEGLLKMAGKFGIKMGSGRAQATGNILPIAELGLAGLKKGIPLVAGATGAKYAQNLVAKAKVERLLKLIEQNKMANAITPQNGMGNALVPASMGMAVPNP